MYLATNGGPGGLGFLIFVLLMVAAVLIVLAMGRSLRRMRAHVDRGEFGADPRSAARADAPSDTAAPGEDASAPSPRGGPPSA